MDRIRKENEKNKKIIQEERRVRKAKLELVRKQKEEEEERKRAEDEK